MRIYKNLKKTILYGIFTIGLLSCTTKKNCITKFKDSESITEFIVLKDSCNVFENNSYEVYYINDTIIMSGYGNRFLKQGDWEYYHKGEIITKGEFKNSNPIGIWNYKNFGKVEWVIKENIDGKYHLSLPKSWKIIKANHISMETVNDTILDNFNVKIEIDVVKADISLDDLYVNISDKFKNENEEFFKIKKWVTLDGVKSFLFEFKTKFRDDNVFIVNNIYFEFNNEIYSISIYVRESSNYAYKIIEEQIIRSFRGIRNSKKNL